jgi:hypothetical protein
LFYKKKTSTLNGQLKEEKKVNSQILFNNSNKNSNSTRASTSNSTDNKWTSNVLAEWVPLIEKDIETQKQIKLTHVNTHSDQYILGMPAKRRKILPKKKNVNKENNGEVVSDSEDDDRDIPDVLNQQLIEKTLQKTLSKIKLKTNVDKNDIYEESLNNLQFIKSFDSELDVIIGERLKNDSDYIEIISNTSNSNQIEPSSSLSNENQQSTLNTIPDESTTSQTDRFVLLKKRFK